MTEEDKATNPIEELSDLIKLKFDENSDALEALQTDVKTDILAFKNQLALVEQNQQIMWQGLLVLAEAIDETGTLKNKLERLTE